MSVQFNVTSGSEGEHTWTVSHDMGGWCAEVVSGGPATEFFGYEKLQDLLEDVGRAFEPGGIASSEEVGS